MMPFFNKKGCWQNLAFLFRNVSSPETAPNLLLTRLGQPQKRALIWRNERFFKWSKVPWVQKALL